MTTKASPQSPASPSPYQPPNRPRFQFSVKTLLKIVTAIAVLLAVLIAMPEIIAFPILMMFAVAFPTVLLAGVLYAKGETRTFAIGGLFAVVALWFLFLGQIGRIDSVLFGYSALRKALGFGISMVLLVIMSCLNGWLCVVARRWFERRADQ
jgi:uncharacterized membrane protein